jgi:superfamily II DNA or RNA helicase
MKLQFYEDTDEGKKKWIQTLKTYINMSEATNSLVIERMVSHFMTERIDYLCNNILAQCDKNTLVLAHHTEYINYITDIIKKRFPNKHIDTITGAVSPKRRDEIKQMLKENTLELTLPLFQMKLGCGIISDVFFRMLSVPVLQLLP